MVFLIRGFSPRRKVPKTPTMNTEPDVSVRVGTTLTPFAGAAILGWITVVVGSTIDWPQYVGATVLLAIAGLLGVAVPTTVSRTSPLRFAMCPVFLLALALLRNSAGGISSGAAGLALIPVFYTAFYSLRRGELYLVLAAVTVFYVAPIILIGPPAYPHTQYRAALLSITVSSIIGLTTQRLVASVRHQAGEARARGRMLEQVNEAVHRLFSSPHARVDVCQAARMISHATAALLYETVGGAGIIRSTAMAGIDADPIEIPADAANAVRDTLLSGRAALITENVAAQVGSLELWTAAGSPKSILYEPLVQAGEPVGVLVVAWAEEVLTGDPRATVAALLAHEAAAVIRTADTLTQLADMAETDPLTGLPNRRAWDAGLARALAADRPVTVGVLDIDHFKQFNDTHGHPAGDRLLKETAARWRDQLRPGDLLARLGGEEFGLLLVDCDANHAEDVVNRLRNRISGGQTCSAGFAIGEPGESAESLTDRADHALYEAKSSGRDRACKSTVSV
jgi:diguanylate cyclase (GGDEF)-like protein